MPKPKREAAKPAVEPGPEPAGGVELGSLVPGSLFELEGQAFTFEGVEGDYAKIVLMKQVLIGVARAKILKSIIVKKS